MLRARREKLPEELSIFLNGYRAKVKKLGGDQAPQDKIDNLWDGFRRKDKENDPSIQDILKRCFHNRCAYCESMDAHTIDHFIPRKPKTENNNCGTVNEMFNWKNLMLACSNCNSDYKGSKWPSYKEKGKFNRLLVKSDEDEPLEYFEYQKNGRIKPLPAATEKNQAQYEETDKLFKLNKRGLPERRACVIQRFLNYCKLLEDISSEIKTPKDRTLQDCFHILFSREEQGYLAPIRQLLCRDKELYNRLLEKMPELEKTLSEWLFPPKGNN